MGPGVGTQPLGPLAPAAILGQRPGPLQQPRDLGVPVRDAVVARFEDAVGLDPARIISDRCGEYELDGREVDPSGTSPREQPRPRAGRPRRAR